MKADAIKIYSTYKDLLYTSDPVKLIIQNIYMSDTYIKPICIT